MPYIKGQKVEVVGGHVTEIGTSGVIGWVGTSQFDESEELRLLVKHASGLSFFIPAHQVRRLEVQMQLAS